MLEQLGHPGLPGTLLVPAVLATTIVLASPRDLQQRDRRPCDSLSLRSPSCSRAFEQLPWSGRRVGAAAAGRASSRSTQCWFVLSEGPSASPVFLTLDYNATWLGLTDQVDGRDLLGASSASRRCSTTTSLQSGYPIGAFLRLGIGARLESERTSPGCSRCTLPSRARALGASLFTSSPPGSSTHGACAHPAGVCCRAAGAPLRAYSEPERRKQRWSRPLSPSPRAHANAAETDRPPSPPPPLFRQW